MDIAHDDGFRVELRSMPHEANIWHAGEDWAGITNQKERKRLQNRLNKRVSRQRKRRALCDSSPDTFSSESITPDNISPILSQSTTVFVAPGVVPSMFSHCTPEDAARKRALLERFADQAMTSFLRADPCADHRLKLIQLNTINAFTRNAAALGYTFDWLICEAVSPFGRDPYKLRLDQRASSIPPIPSSLAPTKAQMSTTHHPWLDLLPLPRMRDNFLLATSALSAEEEQRLFDDIMESGGGKREWTGLVVWGEPWDPASWEVTLPFMRNWGWLLQGCPEMIDSTNRWRAQRGEKPLPRQGFVEEMHEYDEGGSNGLPR